MIDTVPRRAALPAAGQRTGPRWWLRSSLSWLVVLAIVTLLAVVIIIPRLSGSTAYTVLTGSMRPMLPPGTLIVTRPAPPEALGVGDVITYQLRSGQPEVVTHRIISVSFNTRGERTFGTRGDNNAVADTEPVRAVQVRGELWYAVPLVGYLNAWMSGQRRLLILTLVVTTLLGYALVMFVGAARDRYRRRSGVQVRVR